MELMIVMPAYNESANIRAVVDDWYPVVAAAGASSRLVIANDGSRDNTLELLRDLAGDHPQLVVLDKPNGGHGRTLLHLYKYAAEQGAKFIFQTDSDGQTRPEEFKTFWADRHNYDIQIGTRRARQDGKMRIFVSKVLSMVVNLICGVRTVDPNTPFRLMNADTLRECLQIIPEESRLTNVALSASVLRLGKRVCWKPITFRPRQGGKNSINAKSIIKTGLASLKEFRRLNMELAKANKRN